MSFFTEDDFKRIEKSILEAESKTDAEIVAVFARRSDNYYYIPTLVAAVVALVTPSFLMLTSYWLEMGDLLLIQAGLFLCLGLLLRLKPFMSLIIPKFTKARRCNLMARYQFLENNLHTTKDNLGVLIFVSELERQVRILVDHGVAEKFDNKVWEKDIDNFIQKIRCGHSCDGFIDCITNVGKQLATQIPSTYKKNELCNKLVVI